MTDLEKSSSSHDNLGEGVTFFNQPVLYERVSSRCHMHPVPLQISYKPPPSTPRAFAVVLKGYTN
ncbi:hypothetical protein T492DRAFT_54177 [Pavlovales sp. CCMP2436]|nr:hypothetical protein T492DRAFT_54177 [Pavlovales sp. CCMP2436]